MGDSDTSHACPGPPREPTGAAGGAEEGQRGGEATPTTLPCMHLRGELGNDIEFSPTIDPPDSLTVGVNGARLASEESTGTLGASGQTCMEKPLTIDDGGSVEVPLRARACPCRDSFLQRMTLSRRVSCGHCGRERNRRCTIWNCPSCGRRLCPTCKEARPYWHTGGRGGAPSPEWPAPPPVELD